MNINLILLTTLILIICIFSYNNKNYENFKKKLKNNKISKNNKIPKNIIQTWKENIIPNHYYKDIKSVISNNKDYQFLFFNDNDIELFLSKNYPNYYNTYKKLPYKIQKIDFFRYIAVYHYGGFYLDLDMTGYLPLDDLLGHDAIFPIDTFLSDHTCDDKIRMYEFCKNNKFDIEYLLGQYAFGASTKNEFIKYIIDGIHYNIDKYINDVQQFWNYNVYIYKSTGPDYVTRMYINYKNKDNIHILKHDYPQCFGKYAQHNTFGTWK